MKLVLILVLLIVSLMTVVGAFLMNSVIVFYIRDFYTQMNEVFVQDEDFVSDLRTAAPGETDGAQAIQRLLASNMGALGVNGRTRNYYVLDGRTGSCLASSSNDNGSILEDTPNLLTALNDQTEGDVSDVTANYMDLALPITRGGADYIIYIYDNRQMAQELNNSLSIIILEALAFGLVISVLLSFLLSKTMITPIERLTEGVQRVAAGNFSRRIVVSATDEIGVLTDNFNHMARQLQDTIREAENERNKLDTLFLHMKDGVVAFSRCGTVIHKNPAAEKMLGTEISSSASYDSLFHTIAPLDQVLALAQNGYLEDQLQTAGRNLELLLAPFDRESKEGGVMVVIHDVTEQRKAEEMRKDFVANVSHELRTPLTNIRSYAETLAESAELPLEMQQSFLGVILNESDRMAHIVQDLLTLSRFDSGRNELNLSRFSFATAVRDMYSANLMEAQRHDHTVELALAPDLPEIVGDRERIIQVMMNIVSNAIKYTPNGGKIRISAGLKENFIWMEVADNGIGIPPADRSRIFERFYRVDKARSRESGGTGLGLSIAKEIMKRHHGTLELVDRPGPGSTLRMTLPVEGPSHG
ncbi:MAG: cell wall metabolism sensor histidine kinase WalK [Intestinimonas sp.]|jgi:two-component system sensor histidine kinase VicK|nr:cell wall metabolism sensor histidine kinase WalK [Intestinimonas sp.]